jgi:AraC family transcriptional regulator
MKVIVFVKATKSSEAGAMPSTELITAMMEYNQQLVDAGIMLGGEGLHPSSKGVRVLFSGKERTVTQGPFPHTNEIVSGYWIWQVKSMEEAIEWVKRCPNPMPENSEIEIRPLFTAEDFGEALTPELREQEDLMRNQVPEPDRWEKKPARLFAGISRTYTFSEREKIPAHWQEFVQHFGKIDKQVGVDSYGICWSANAETFDYLTAVEISEQGLLPEGFTTLELVPQHYAVFIHYGHSSGIPQTIAAIWEKWLPASGLKAANAPCYERYTSEYNPETGTGGTEIWIPIQQ